MSVLTIVAASAALAMRATFTGVAIIAAGRRNGGASSAAAASPARPRANHAALLLRPAGSGLCPRSLAPLLSRPGRELLFYCLLSAFLHGGGRLLGLIASTQP